MKRNINVDVFRAIAMISVVVYHIYAITGVTISNEFIKTILIYGGEYGVAIFFLLSGFSIYTSINRKKENFKFQDFIFKRMERLLPQYYICILFLLFFTNFAVYLNSEQIYNLFSHIFLFHDQYPSAAGAINGVCWSLGVIFQFYLISPILYKCIEKCPKLTVVFSILISIGIKGFLFHYIFAVQNAELNYYFNFGKAIYTSLDTFVLGMLLGKLITIPENNKKIVKNILGLLFSVVAFVIWLYVDSKRIPILGENTGLYSDCFESYIWHTVLAIILTVMIYLFSKIKLSADNIIMKSLLFISKYEYGIYIWHLVLIVTLYQNNGFIQNLAGGQRKLTYVILFALSIASGAIISEIIDNIDFKALYSKFKEIIKYSIKISICLAILIMIYESIILIPQIYNNFKNISSNNISFHTDSINIAENAKENIEENKKYLYIDTRATGYQYFFELRYFLSPRESIHYNAYADIINDKTVQEIYTCLNTYDVDYYIIRDCPILEEYFKKNYNEKIGTIYKKNKNSTSIDDLFIEVKGIRKEL